MVSQRELHNRRELYATLHKILSALKALAYAEIHKLQRQIEPQQAITKRMSRAITRLRSGVNHKDGAALIVAVGTERGFCGDINHRLVEQLKQISLTRQNDSIGWVLIGDRLIQQAGDSLNVVLNISGASVAEDVESVVDAVIEEALNKASQFPIFNMQILFYDEPQSGVRLFPVFPAPKPSCDAGIAPLLYRSPVDLLSDLIPMYLFTVLQSCIKGALLGENKRRLSHLENATRHLNERMDSIAQKSNRARQESIIEEIEALLASDITEAP